MFGPSHVIDRKMVIADDRRHVIESCQYVSGKELKTRDYGKKDVSGLSFHF